MTMLCGETFKKESSFLVKFATNLRLNLDFEKLFSLFSLGVVHSTYLSSSGIGGHKFTVKRNVKVSFILMLVMNDMNLYSLFLRKH